MEPHPKRRPTPWAFYIGVVLLALLAAMLLVPIFRRYQMRQKELSHQQRIQALHIEESARLQKEVDALQHSPSAVEKVAREKFELSREGETILRYPAPPKK